jgi:hypothetical protein
VSVVITTFHAGAQIGTRSALRAQVKECLESILDVALEMKQFPGGYVPSDARLVARVDGHEVSYSLDLENGCATILAVDPAGNQAAASSIERIAR